MSLPFNNFNVSPSCRTPTPTNYPKILHPHEPIRGVNEPSLGYLGSARLFWARLELELGSSLVWLLELKLGSSLVWLLELKLGSTGFESSSSSSRNQQYQNRNQNTKIKINSQNRGEELTEKLIIIEV